MLGNDEHVTQVGIAHAIGDGPRASHHGPVGAVVDADYSPGRSPLTFDVLASSPTIPIRLGREKPPDDLEIDSLGVVVDVVRGGSVGTHPRRYATPWGVAFVLPEDWVAPAGTTIVLPAIAIAAFV